MQISKRTKYKFGEFATEFAVLRQIDDVFVAEDFEPVENYSGLASGMRRSLVAGYHAAIDFSDPAQLGRLIRVYADAIDSWGRDDTGELVPAARDMIRSLQRDGVPISDDGELTTTVVALNVPLSDFHRLSDPRVVQQHLERISVNVERDPPSAVGSAKELVESVCKFILDDYGVAYGKADSLLDLYKQAAKALKLNREAVPSSVKGSESAQKVLQNLAPLGPKKLHKRVKFFRGCVRMRAGRGEQAVGPPRFHGDWFSRTLLAGWRVLCLRVERCPRMRSSLEGGGDGSCSGDGDGGGRGAGASGRVR